LDRALAKDSNARFNTMEDFASAVSGERSGPTTVVSEPVRAHRPLAPVGAGSPAGSGQAVASPPVKPGKPAADHEAGVLVALATVAVIALAAWFALPGFQSIVERSASSRPAATRNVVTPPVSRPPAASRPVRRTPVVAVSPSSGKKRGPAKLKTVQHALLRVDSDPWAVLYVDGVRVGLTPVANHRLPFGTHRLRVEQKGYQALTETIVVKGTGPVSRRYTLRRRQAR
jgi:serine/threonine-protein kinase